MRPIKTRFPCGSGAEHLNLATKGNSLARSTKSTMSHSLIVLHLLVSIGFQVLFHSPPGVLFTFPSQYFSTIGHQVVFSLRGWSPCLHTEFLVLRATLDTASSINFSLTGLSPSSVSPSNELQLSLLNRLCSPNPKVPKYLGLGSSSFARRYLRNHLLIFSSWGYLDVSVPLVSLPYTMCSYMDTWTFTPGGFPHSDSYGSMFACNSP